MGTFKKISCIISVVLVLIVGILPSYAELTELPFSYPVRLTSFAHHVADNNHPDAYWTTFQSYEYSSLPSDTGTVNFGVAYPSNPSPYDRYRVSVGVNVVDENNVTDYLHNDYSYVLSYFLVLRTRKTNGEASYLFPDQFSFVLSTGYDLYDSNTLEFYIDSGVVYNYLCTIDYEVTENTENYLSMLYTVTFSFTVPSSEDFPIMPYPWFNCTFFSEISDHLYGTGLQATCRAYNFYGVFDPEGEAIDDPSEVDQIIAGQKEAAEYALEQESAANEAALQESLDNADTSAFEVQDTFGGALLSLYNAFTYSGTSFNFELPSSGVIPLLNTELWSAQTIPIKDYIDKVPSAVWIILNFLLWFMVVRSVIKFLHFLLDLISGNSAST